MAGRDHLSYANVTASLALFIALGGSAYAAATIDSGDVVNNSLTGRDIKNESIRSADVRGLRAGDFARGQLPDGATGPAGPAGARGAQGAQGAKGDRGIPGPIAGTPAGGALTGTYPNPGIANGAVGPNALAALPGARANAANPSSIGNGEATVDLVTEAFDTGGMYTAGNDSITVQRAGTYLVTGWIHWPSSAGTERQLRIVRNTTEVQRVRDTNTTAYTQEVDALLRLSASDAISLETYQDSGGNVNTANFAEPGAWLAIQYLSG